MTDRVPRRSGFRAGNGRLRMKVRFAVAIAAALWAYARYSRLGLVVRASAENEKGAILLGYSPNFLAGFSFVLASLVGGFIAILASPMIQLTSTAFHAVPPNERTPRCRCEMPARSPGSP